MANTSSDLTLDDQAAPPNDSTAELTTAVDALLNQLATKFSTVSNELFTKMDDMSKRLDKLEATIQAQQRTGEAAGGDRGSK